MAGSQLQRPKWEYCMEYDFQIRNEPGRFAMEKWSVSTPQKNVCPSPTGRQLNTRGLQKKNGCARRVPNFVARSRNRPKGRERKTEQQDRLRQVPSRMPSRPQKRMIAVVLHADSERTRQLNTVTQTAVPAPVKTLNVVKPATLLHRFLLLSSSIAHEAALFQSCS